jgi:pimeloyl-ACP methyl ester carboxylesterase
MFYGRGVINPTPSTLHVPGATLYYQARGRGPVLLIVMGGGGDAGAADDIALRLADQFTVVTYDRRGLSRSALVDPAEFPTIETHSDDASRLLAEITSEPAFVVGFSIGAIIALDLAAKHPEQIRVLIAHEPPLGDLLPPSDQDQITAVRRAIESGTRGEEWAEVFRQVKVDHTDVEPGVQIATPNERTLANTEFFRRRDAKSAHQYITDLDALRPLHNQIIAAGGEKSREGFPYRAACALGDILDARFIEFPGDHAGFATRPRAFATKLVEVLYEAGQR